ncbi:MAG: DUF885 domain-containing protein [Chloroflexi bacterium]|nr:DUF885 domain-containing protein [Chloroflexota bacterium]
MTQQPARSTPVYRISDDFVERFAALDPLAATSMGVSGHDAEMTDFSPDGLAARHELQRESAAALRVAPVEDEADRIARDVMVERLDLAFEMYAANTHLYELNILHSPTQSIRSSFDLMPRANSDDWANIAARLRAVPDALAGVRATLEHGAAQGLLAAVRQCRGVAQQCDVYGGAREGQRSFFHGLLDAYEASPPGNDHLGREIAAAADIAAAAYLEHGCYLVDDYLPRATPQDPVGRESYQLRSRAFNGIELDLDETYAWGWEELWRIQAEMSEVAGRIKPGADAAGAIDMLDTDPDRAIEGEEPFRQWMQDLQDDTIASFDGVHFDIPEPVRRIEAMIAPPGGALAMYYTGPSEDFSRPGRTWYPTGGHTRFPLWREVSIAYHEGVPGHHLQIAQTRYLGDTLSRYQRLLAGTSGYAEGWALYAERLMAELGYLDNPDHYMGLLCSQALRAVRVVIDIGMHLELEIPQQEAYHPGETWTPELALPFLMQRSYFPADMLASEVDRYLGMPGQAISYKVGERIWLASREEARARAGAAFDLKAWHTAALNLGPMGLAQMQRELATI